MGEGGLMTDYDLLAKNLWKSKYQNWWLAVENVIRLHQENWDNKCKNCYKNYPCETIQVIERQVISWAG